MKKILSLIFLTLGIGIFIGCQKVSPESKRMDDLWEMAQEYRKDDIPMPKDTMFLRAFQYFREKGDSDKLLESYLLEAFYYTWNKEAESAIKALDEGLQYSVSRKDTNGIIALYRVRYNLLYRNGLYQKALQALEELLKFKEKLSVMELSYTIYRKALNLSLTGNLDADSYYEESLQMALSARDTTVAVHILRNYADALSQLSVRNYKKSNELIKKVFQISPQFKLLPHCYITLVQNHLNLQQIDSAQYYFNIAREYERLQQEKNQQDASCSASLIFLQKVLIQCSKFFVCFFKRQILSGFHFSVFAKYNFYHWL